MFLLQKVFHSLFGINANFKVNADRNLAIKYDTNITLSAQGDAGGPESFRMYADTLRIYTATTAVGLTERFSIGNGGKVAISSSVAGDVLLNVVNSSSTGNGMNISAGSSSSNFALRVENYNGLSTLLYVRGDGNVGIGTSSPNSLLSLNSTAVYYIDFQQSGTSKGLIGVPFSANQLVGGSASGDLVIRNTSRNTIFTNDSGNTSALYINSSNNVLIGTTTDSGYKLEVNGAIKNQNNVANSNTAGAGAGVWTTVLSLPQLYSSGSLACVIGDNGGSAFCDIVAVGFGNNAAAIVSSTIYGSPGSRSYRRDSNNLQINPSNAHNIRATALAGNIN